MQQKNSRHKHFNDYFPSKRGLVGCLLDSQSPVIHILHESRTFHSW